MNKSYLLHLIFCLFSFSAVAQNTIWYVAPNGSGNGSSWSSAAGNLQTVIDNAIAGDQIWVRQGTYQRAPGQYFSVKDGVSLYGGFPATAAPQMNDRNPRVYETILSGNQSRVLESTGQFTPVSATTIIDGFTLTNGNFSSGAGLYVYNSNATFRNLKITGNTATQGLGAGVQLVSSSSALIQVLIYGNTSVLTAGSDGDSGGMRIQGGSPKLYNCVIANNHAQGYIGGIWAVNASVYLYNSIVYGNTADLHFTTTNANDNFWMGVNVNAYAANCILQGSRGSDYYMESPRFIIYGNDLGGNLDTLPLFNTDYSLQASSPGINKGSTAAYLSVAGNMSKDFYNNNRIVDSVDIGLSEFQSNIPAVLYVKANGTGDGSSWANASGNLQAMIDKQIPGQAVWVAAGTYSAAQHYFKLRSGVKIYGGFPNSGNPAFTDRNFTGTPSILNSSFSTIVGNFYPETRKLPASALLDGFTITGNNTVYYGVFESNSEASYANITFRDLQRTAVEIRRKSNSSFTDCIFRNNSLTDHTSSVVYLHTDAKATFLRCTFMNNNANMGATLKLRNNCTAEVSACLFKNNALSGPATVVYVDNSSILIDSTKFEANGYSGYEGAIVSILSDTFNNEPSWTHPSKVSINKCIFNNNELRGIHAQGKIVDTLSVTNSLFYKNKGSSGGALIKHSKINLFLTNCTFTENRATNQFAGAIFLMGTGGVNVIRNSIIYNNTAPYSYASELYTFEPVSFKNSIIRTSGGSSNWNAGIFNDYNLNPMSTDLGGNLDVNPLFVNTAAFDYSLQGTSPALNAGDNSLFNAGAVPDISAFDTDLAGNIRILDAIIDMGAYEYLKEDDVDTPTLVRNINARDEFSIYPNPTTGKITINSKNVAVKGLAVYSVSGTRLLYTSGHVGDLSSLPAGIYILSIVADNNKTYSTRIIKY